MIRVRKYIACLVMLVLFLSSWASAADPCGHPADIAGTSQGAVVDHSMHNSDTAPDTEFFENESSADECPCCTACETMCVLSACSAIALPGPQLVLALNSGYAHFPQVSAFHAGPPPHVLYRPPIISV